MNAFSEFVTTAARSAGYEIDGPRSGGRTALSEASELSLATVSRMLSGRAIPDPYSFPRLACALHVSVEELLRKAGILPELTEDERSVRASAFHDAADELERIADAVEVKVAESFGAASGIGPGSAQMVRESAHAVRRMAIGGAA